MEKPADQPKTLLEAIRYFTDLDVAAEFVAKFRWPDGPICPVKPYHLFRYLDEQAVRFNEREGEDRDRFSNALGSVDGRQLTYSESIGKTETLQP